MSNAPICNCKDEKGNPLEFRTTLCPVCDVNKTNDSKGYIPEKIILNDSNLIVDGEQPKQWIGHAFKCSKCSCMIMHDMKFCPGCGVEVLVQSYTVTKYIQQLSKR